LAAKHDIQRRITADIEAEADQVVEACERAAEPINDHKRLETRVEIGNGKVLISLLVNPLMRATAPGKQSWVTVVEFDVGRDGAIHLETNLARYKTLQSHVFGFVPAGPKSLVCRQQFLMLLDALENELRALDPEGTIARS
jgi:hypothetical protein